MEIILLAFVMALTFTGYYAMVLFPRQRDFQKRQLMARELVEGDEIVTYGGIIGKVKQIDSAKGVAMVEIAAMMHRYDPDEIAKNAQMGLANQNDATSTT
jgi:preprotein translocase YajC subunit